MCIVTLHFSRYTEVSISLKDYKEMAWLMERIMHKYAQYEKKPQIYCKDLLLTQPEIHTVTMIGDNPGISVTELAMKRGVTKGAASQMVYKLVDKGLVEKRISPDSDAQRNLYLTEKGMQARNDHRKLHETMGMTFSRLFDEIPEEISAQMIHFLKAFEDELDEFL
ncbi:DNA-binding transcriptional regulator, MarR family [[Clostridium] aminophilum]|uniref:DNA-binding transcriptional regulator, MarR family n=1 Tax=[Clostridium] aminophilum TaxID=1526 RepID=A0A1I6JWK5_9FIRM|nr:DNA-binding transcriptional regulator, MarR family [[Clostridium] aminophilum]